jgi:hypothetical protein
MNWFQTHGLFLTVPWKEGRGGLTDEQIRRANEAYDRIHGPARVIPIPPEHRIVSGTPVPGGPHRPWRRFPRPQPRKDA